MKSIFLFIVLRLHLLFCQSAVNEFDELTIESNETNSSNSLNSSNLTNETQTFPINETSDLVAESLCFNWWKQQFFQKENFEETRIIPFSKFYSRSNRIHSYASKDEIIIFNECRNENHIKCEQEMYAILMKNTSSIRKVKHTLNPSYDFQDAIFTEYDPDVKNQMFKIIADQKGKVKVLKLCDVSTVEKKILKIKDYGWIPFKSNSSDVSFFTQAPIFRTDTSLIILRSPNKEALQGEHFDLILYGGQSDAGNFNDISIFSPSKKKWYKAICIGNVPNIKGHSAIIFYEEFTGLEGKLVIFGGIIDGVISNDLYVGEITFIKETYYIDVMRAEADGDVPSPRFGHKVFLRNNKMILLGGCNQNTAECFNDVYSLDLLKLPMTWTLVDRIDKRIALPSAREGFALAVTKDVIMIFGGCNQLGDCFKDSYQLDMKDECKIKCPFDNMKFDSLIGDCLCNPGFAGKTCNETIQVRCPHKCSGHGLCTESRECLCDNNYYGEKCQFEFCKDNCMGHGVCNKTSLSCKCSDGFYGENCEAICPRNCTTHGTCVNNKCQCFPGFSGNKCDLREDIQGCWKFQTGKFACFKLGIDGIYGAIKEPGSFFIFKENEKKPLTSGFRFREKESHKFVGKLFSKNSNSSKSVTDETIELIQTLDVLEYVKIRPTGEILRDVGARNPDCEESRECSGHGICIDKNICSCISDFDGIFCQRDLVFEVEAARIESDEKKKEEEKFPDYVNVEEHRKIVVNAPLETLLSINTSALAEMLGIELYGVAEEIDIHNLTETLTSVLEKINKLEEEEGKSAKSSESEENETNSNTNETESTENMTKGRFGKLFANLSLPSGIELSFNGSTPILNVKRQVKRLVKMRRKDVRNKTSIIEIDPQEEAKLDAKKKEVQKKFEKENAKAQKRQEKAQKLLEKRSKKKARRKSATELRKEAKEAAEKEARRRSCAFNCNGNGICKRGNDTGYCECFFGWNGNFCHHPFCPQNCTLEINSKIVSSGICNQNQEKCLCYAGFSGNGCRDLIPCPNNCTDFEHGVCQKDGTCKCTEKFWLDDCSWFKCPNDCNNNGICINGTCRCYEGYFESDCSSSCKHNCSAQGICKRGDCLCFRGFGGEDCGYPLECEGNCSNHGKCVLGDCYCEAGWEGPSCSEVSTCPDHCSGRGHCLHGSCHCFPGFAGTRCEFKIVCPNACSNHGKCMWGKCFCDPGFEKFDCSGKINCPQNCSGHGTCFDGECYCEPEYSGHNCSKLLLDIDKCKENCNHLGICKEGKCICFQGFSGEVCNVEDLEYTNICRLKNNSAICEANGMCVKGECKCFPGFHGKFCNETFSNCMNNCTSARKGTCIEDRCICKFGWEGEDCSSRSICPQDCNQRGQCFKGNCICDKGFMGLNCSQVPQSDEELHSYLSKLVNLLEEGSSCKDNCNNHGTCQDSRCVCNNEYEGTFCEIFNPLKCVGDCNGRGICKQGRCFCFLGFAGINCESVLPCPNACSKNGVCRHGVCYCLEGFDGIACEHKLSKLHVPLFSTGDVESLNVKCPNDCFGRGLCIEGVCYCEEGYFGFNCANREDEKENKCVDDCLGNGECIAGKCYCFPGFNGINCGRKTSFLCPGNGFCSLHGNCYNGKCECDPYYSGNSCEVKRCSPFPKIEECSKRGICRNGNCICDPGWSGPDCEVFFNSTGCPGDCSQKGKCLNGACACIEGYTGVDCAILKMRFKEHDPVDFDLLKTLLSSKSLCREGCNGKGKCDNGKCQCEMGYFGESCEEKAFGVSKNGIHFVNLPLECLENSDCKNGKCLEGTCVCFPNFTGIHCQTQSQISSNAISIFGFMILLSLVLTLGFTCLTLILKTMTSRSI